MSQTTELLILVIALAVLIVSVLLIQRRQRVDRESKARESPYAVSTEGQKRCPSCGMFNGWTERTCVSCGRRLEG
ncbi:MAG TPA: hypothetical protein VFP22_09325 [Candidatus Limnocylindrales bacterium]|nr:hypothetical protein [Candidatus Limnocylindrales bacterium]